MGTELVVTEQASLSVTAWSTHSLKRSAHSRTHDLRQRFITKSMPNAGKIPSGFAYVDLPGRNFEERTMSLDSNGESQTLAGTCLYTMSAKTFGF